MCDDRHIKPAESLLRLTKYSIANELFNCQIDDIPVKASMTFIRELNVMSCCFS